LKKYLFAIFAGFFLGTSCGATFVFAKSAHTTKHQHSSRHRRIKIVKRESLAFASSQKFHGLNLEKPPKVQSPSAIVVSVPVGQVIFEKDADEVRPIASLSKLMSAIVYMEHCGHLDLDGLHEMSTQNRDMAKGGDKTKLITGWSYSRRDLLKAALMRSDNRALPALMESCGLNLQTFVMFMNWKAKELGLQHTNFVEPTGLSALNLSTAREYVKVTVEATKFPVLTEIMQTKQDTIIGYRHGKARKIETRSTNYLLGRRGVEVIGAKTGYTDIARYCFTVLNRIVDNTAVTMVFLGGEGKHTRFGDFSRVQRWLNERVNRFFAHEQHEQRPEDDDDEKDDDSEGT
jgi:serine-type D-Ala-D-Ala endopeptidase (penicillin-binding protein 7)